MSKTLSDDEIRRIKQLFRDALHRDLSSEEQKYLALSSVAIPISDLELIDPNHDKISSTLINED